MEHFIFPNPAAGRLLPQMPACAVGVAGTRRGVPAGGDCPQKREAQATKDLACPSFMGASPLHAHG